MGLGKQAKTLSKRQVDQLLWFCSTRRNSLRNQVIVLLSVKAGLRAKEMANLKWSMVTDSSGQLSDAIHLTNNASKGKSGRVIPINSELRSKLIELFSKESQRGQFSLRQSYVIRTERSERTSAQAVVNMFAYWYAELGFTGCSSHSGRRTFITNAARKISQVGGSLRDVQSLAGHSSVSTTERYIDTSRKAKRLVVQLI